MAVGEEGAQHAVLAGDDLAGRIIHEHVAVLGRRVRMPHAKGGGDHVRPFVRDHLVERRQRSGQQAVVAVDKGDVLAARVAQAGVARLRNALVGLLEQRDRQLRMGGLQAAHDVRRAVGGTIVNHYQLVIALHLRQNVLQAVGDIGLAVVAGHDQADGRHLAGGHVGKSFRPRVAWVVCSAARCKTTARLLDSWSRGFSRCHRWNTSVA